MFTISINNKARTFATSPVIAACHNRLADGSSKYRCNSTLAGLSSAQIPLASSIDSSSSLHGASTRGTLRKRSTVVPSLFCMAVCNIGTTSSAPSYIAHCKAVPDGLLCCPRWTSTPFACQNLTHGTQFVLAAHKKNNASASRRPACFWFGFCFFRLLHDKIHSPAHEHKARWPWFVTLTHWVCKNSDSLSSVSGSHLKTWIICLQPAANTEAASTARSTKHTNITNASPNCSWTLQQPTKKCLSVMSIN